MFDRQFTQSDRERQTESERQRYRDRDVRSKIGDHINDDDNNNNNAAAAADNNNANNIYLFFNIQIGESQYDYKQTIVFTQVSGRKKTVKLAQDSICQRSGYLWNRS